MKRDVIMYLLIAVLLFTGTLFVNDPITGENYFWSRFALDEPTQHVAIIPNAPSRPEPPGFDAWWEVPQKPSIDTVYTVEYWQNDYLHALMNAFPEDYARGDTQLDAETLHQLIALYASKNAGSRWAPFSGHLGHTLHLQRDVYLQLVARFTGSDADPNYIDIQVPDYIGETGRTVMLPQPRNSFGWNDDRTGVVHISLPDGDVDRVLLHIGFRGYTPLTEADPSYVIAYTLIWDDTLGYVPESITWLSPELPDHGLSGPLFLFDTLWGQGGNDVVNPPFYDSRYYFYTVGSTAYHFYADEATLIADTFHMATTEQQVAIPFFEASDAIQAILPDESGIVVITETTLYRIDYAGKVLIERAQPENWPEALRYPVYSKDLRHCAFATEEGVFLLDLDGDDEPTKLTGQHPDYNHPEMVWHKNYYPRQFVGNNKLLLSIQAWEWIDGYVLVDLDGGGQDNLDIYVSGVLAGGYFYNSTASAVYFAPAYDEHHHHASYHFENGALFPLTELEAFHFNMLQQCLSPLDDPLTWYINANAYIEGRSDITIGSHLYRIDASKGTVEMLPLEIMRASTRLLAADREGRVLFAYAGEEGQGFGLYLPEGLDN